jgi:hypothetical protein
MTIEPKLTTRWGQIARTAGLALLWAGLVLGSGAAVATESDAQPPYPVWWSPVLELDSLDAIDARLARALWEHDPEGMTLYKSEGDTRLEVQANSCIELKRLVVDGYEGVGSRGYWLRQLKQAECTAITMLKDAESASTSYLHDFRLDSSSVNYLPAAAALKPSCYRMCREAAANDRRIPLTGVYEVIGVDALSDGQLDFWLNDWKIRLTLLARADFTGDGLEDLLLLSSGGTIMGRGAWAHLFLLSRDASNTVFHVPNLNRHDYWRCDCEQAYDDPEIFRDSDPSGAN